ncbi:MAG: MurR/RpiR family transcriptional regulator [Kiritimatiellae bacterium]|nr:MurR/RpiR family transcriptional regulator [Kiritimatiellia bacterium]
MSLSEQHAARIPHRCLIRLKSVYATLKGAERRAMDFILGHAEAAADASIVTVARGAGCSEATLTRLARRMGYAGYAELKADLRRGDDPENGLIVYRDINRDDDCLTVARKVFAASIQSLSDTLSILNRDAYEAAVRALLGARRMVFCGLGDAGQVALSAAQKFLRLNADCRASEDPDLQLILCTHLAKGDVLLAISHSGQSRTVLAAVAQARKRRATVLAITNFRHSPLAKAADVVLLTADFSEHVTGEVISKRVSELCLIESLYVNYLLARGGACLGALRQSNKAVEGNKL